MKNAFQKLAATFMAAATLVPTGSMAAPAITNVQQMQTSVDATFNNTFTQSVSVSGANAAGIAATDVTTGAGADFGNTATYTLTPTLTTPTLGGSVVGGGTVPTIGNVTGVDASMATTAGVGAVLQINPANVAGESVSVSTTVFGVENIRATQSVVESTTNTMF